MDFDPEEIGPILRSAKTFYDIIRSTIAMVKKSPDTASDGLKEAVNGKADTEAEAALKDLLDFRAIPFLLRMGLPEKFSVPTATEDLEQMVITHNIWDWTYIYGCKKHVHSDAVPDLKTTYCDSEDNTLFHPDIQTTSLYIFNSKMDNKLGDALYLGGVVLGTRFRDLHATHKRNLLPCIAIRIEGSDYRAFEDPIMLAHFVHEAMSEVKRAFGQPKTGVTIHNTPDDRTIPLEMQIALGIR